MLLPWRRKHRDANLSRYLDGELDGSEMDEVTERLVLDDSSAERLDAYSIVSRLVDLATGPPGMPDSEAAADRVLGRLAVAPAAGAVLSFANPRYGRRRHLTPALLASLGLLLTAGVTIVGLRRRGIV
ncbi:hypothetical protein ACFL6X_05205 [Candidatus Latescibacterota bacterium]